MPKKSNVPEKKKKLQINKRTLKDLNTSTDKVRGGVLGTAPVSDTCKTICKGHC